MLSNSQIYQITLCACKVFHGLWGQFDDTICFRFTSDVLHCVGIDTFVKQHPHCGLNYSKNLIVVIYHKFMLKTFKKCSLPSVFRCHFVQGTRLFAAWSLERGQVKMCESGLPTITELVTELGSHLTNNLQVFLIWCLQFAAAVEMIFLTKQRSH